MNEAELRQVLAMQAVELLSERDSSVPWRPDDGAWASVEAHRQLGEAKAQAASDGRQAFLLARARLGLQRLGARVPALAALTESHVGWWPVLLPLGAGLLGLVGDALATGGRINLLALPLLGLLGWNLLVYLGLLLKLLFGARQRQAHALGDSHGQTTGRRWPPGQALLLWLWRRPWPWQSVPGAHGLHLPGHVAEPAWLGQVRHQLRLALWQAGSGVARQRVVALMHACAATLALGALLSMYARGLVLDYRAGWDSTFLDAQQVHALLSLVLAPATVWPGLGLPDVASLAQWRWADGSAGAPAAPWIHRLAITTGVLVLLPRGVLAWWAVGRARAMAGRLQPPLAQAYFQRLLRQQHPTQAAEVWVLPYSYHLPEASQAGLAPALSAWLDLDPDVKLADSLPMGIEDELPDRLPVMVPGWPPAAGLPGAKSGGPTSALPPPTVVVMALTATPERETHGAFLQRLQALMPAGQTLHLLLDSAVFVQRLAGQAGAGDRLAQRVAAWQRLLGDLGLPPAQVVDLSEAGVSLDALGASGPSGTSGAAPGPGQVVA